MNTHLLDKAALFLLSVSLCIYSIQLSSGVILGVLITISFFCLSYYYDHPTITLVLFSIHLFLSILSLPFMFFMSPIVYDMHTTKYKKLGFLTVIPLLYHVRYLPAQTHLLIVLILLLSLFFATRTKRLQELEARYISIRDDSEERKLVLEKKNEELMEVQDYEIHMATLKERNRIAREIHDNVGHLLSRSILQVGAFLAITTDETAKESLHDIKNTLNTAMTNIRESVHDIHDESIDLNFEINEMVSHFTFCTIDCEYSITSDLDRKYKYSILAILKESLSNVIKHSQATHVSLILREHPGLFQILISDNGPKAKTLDDSGIGLKNMSDRVESMKGTLRITTTDGFRIFISIPKQERKH